MKTNRLIGTSLFITIILLAVLMLNCKKEDNETAIIKEKISGIVQKGPFVNGTEISMYELNSSMVQTGNVFSTQINNNRGTFEIDNISLSSQFVEFSASGYYFDEVKGEVSVAPLNLFALSDITDISTVNVNILTHLEKSRVENLVSNGADFSTAKATAQSEILTLFGFNNSSMNNSETLDISVNSEANAVLLAISIILQGNRSVGNLTELLANFSTTLEDGIIGDEGFTSGLRQELIDLDLDAIRTNLESRFQQLGVITSIPDFEKYINDFLSFTGQAPIIIDQPVSNITTTGATLNASVCANSLTTEVSIEYGLSESYGNSATVIPNQIQGFENVEVKADLGSLSPGTLYHFRVKAENARGTAYSSDLTFTTLGEIPTAITTAATNFQFNTATINGLVDSNSLSTLISFEWGTSSAYGNSVTADISPLTGDSSVNVSADLTGLTQGTSYHYRVIAVNELGTTTGEDMTFTTLSPLTDIEGNVYNVVTIGTQVWMAENLKTSRYSNGDPIGTTDSATLDINAEVNPKYQWAYNGDESKVEEYGRLYTWYAVSDSRNVCPTGWHVPSASEANPLADWNILTDYLTDNGYGFEGNGDDIAKSLAATSGWTLSPDMIQYDITSLPGNVENDLSSNNSSGFNAIPVGDRSTYGFFDLNGNYFAYWWSSSESYNGMVFVKYLLSGTNRFPTGGTQKKLGLSVRCLKD